MKKLICFTIILLTFLFSNKLTAQGYTPLVVDSSNYVVGYDDIVTPFYDDYWGYQILGDTVFNGRIFKKVYRLDFLHSGNVYYNPPNPLILTGKILCTLIREENKKIYAVNFTSLCFSNNCELDTTEYLLYDFNINIGDSINLCINSIFPKDIIDTSIVTFNSLNYKTYLFETLPTDYLIEGVGSSYGLYEMIGCYYKSACTKLWNYSRGALSTCSILSDNKIIYQDNKINIYPNPTTEKLTVNIKQFSSFPFSILIYDSHGKKVKQINSYLNESFIDISDLPKGIYEIIIIGDNLNFNERFVKL